MSIPLAPDEKLGRLFFHPVAKQWVRFVYRKGRIVRWLRYIKIIVAYRTDYLNPERPGHRLAIELTVARSVSIEKEIAEKELKEYAERRYGELCEAEGLPDLRKLKETSITISVDYEESYYEGLIEEERIRWEH